MTTTPDRKDDNDMGNIGEGQREYEYEPLTAPSVPEPSIAPVETPEREEVPV